MTKYKDIDMTNRQELSSIAVGDTLRINDWVRGMKVIHRTENHLLLTCKQFSEELVSVFELIPAKSSYNNIVEGYFTAGGDSWLFGWEGWRDENLNTIMDKPRMEAYLRSFESGETTFSRRAVAIEKMQILRPGK